MSFLDNFTSEAPVFNGEQTQGVILGVGTHNVQITKIFETNSFVEGVNSPKMKTALPEWKDPDPQVLVMMRNNTGVAVHRFNFAGYRRFDELTEAERVGVIPVGEDGYACDEATMIRIKSPERTAKAVNIFNQFMASCGLPVGSKAKQLPGCKVQIDIEAKGYGDKTINKVVRFRKIAEETVGNLVDAINNAETVEANLEPEI